MSRRIIKRGRPTSATPGLRIISPTKAAAGVVPGRSPRHVLFARVYLDSGQERIATADLRADSEYFDGRIVGVEDYIDRSISNPVRIPEIADASLRIADTDGTWRDLIATQTAQLRLVDVFLVEENMSISGDSMRLYSGIISELSRGPGYLDVRLADRTFAWLDETIPGTLTKENYPALDQDVDEVFLPWIFGQVRSPSSNRTGIVPLPFVNQSGDSAGGLRWGVAAHPISEFTVYRKRTGENAFTEVAITDYTLQTELVDFDGYSALATFVQLPFDVDDLDAELRADIDGELTDSASDVPRDFVTTFEALVDAAFAKTGENAGVAPLADMSALKTRLETAIPWAGGSPMLCDGAITSALTFREVLGRLLQSCQADMYQTKAGEITLDWSNAENEDRTEFDEWLIIKSSFTDFQGGPDLANRVPVRYSRNYAKRSWIGSVVVDHEADQMALGAVDVDTAGDPLLDSTGLEEHSVKVIRETQTPLDLWFVRDRLTAEFAGTYHLGFTVWAAKKQTFRLPAPETADDLELSARIGVTMSEHAYSNQEVRVTGLSLLTESLEFALKTRIHSPADFRATSGFDVYLTSQLWLLPPELLLTVASLVGGSVDYATDNLFWSLHVGGDDYGYGIDS